MSEMLNSCGIPLLDCREDPFERRKREREEIEKREQERATRQAQATANNVQYLCDLVDKRLEQHFLTEPDDGVGGALIDDIVEAFKTERGNRQKELKAAVAEVEAKLAERLKAISGRLPVAKTWHPESVSYEAQLVSHDGPLWQARQDTAQAPGGSDWICVARAGRDGCDAATPSVRGKFDARKTYAQLDVIEYEGNSFLAMRDDPGIPGFDDGWQLLCARGDRGPAGERGERGLRGARGPRGEAAPKIITWTVDPVHYRAVPTLADGSEGPAIELRGLLQGFLNEAVSALVDQAVKDAIRGQP